MARFHCCVCIEPPGLMSKLGKLTFGALNSGAREPTQLWSQRSCWGMSEQGNLGVPMHTLTLRPSLALCSPTGLMDWTMSGVVSPFGAELMVLSGVFGLILGDPSSSPSTSPTVPCFRSSPGLRHLPTLCLASPAGPPHLLQAKSPPASGPGCFFGPPSTCCSAVKSCAAATGPHHC